MINILFKDREVISNGRVRITDTEGESCLMIHEAQLTDAAMYKVRIENSTGDETLAAKVTVEDKGMCSCNIIVTV